MQTLQSAYEVTIRTLPSLNVNDLSLFSQTALHDLLRAAKEPPLLEHLLRRRWSSRWSANFQDGIPIGAAVRRAHRCVSVHASQLPPFLKYTMACTWLNGWCTAHRFQGRANCPFCHGPTDALEHYVNCRAVRILFLHHLGAAHGSFVEFLGLHTDFAAFSRQALGLHGRCRD